MRHIDRKTLACLVVMGTLAVPLLAQEKKDLLQEAKARQVVKAQEFEQRITEMQGEAARIGKAKPGEAADLLRSALNQLEEDQLLSEEKRAKMIRITRALLRDFQADVRDRNNGVFNPLPRERSDARVSEIDRQRADVDFLTRQQNQARAAQASGNSFEAARIYNEMAKRFPDNPGVQGGRAINSLGTSVAAGQDIKNRRAESMLMVVRGIEKATLVPAGDVDFPSDWAEKSKRRSSKNNLTEKEKMILKALETPIPAEFNGATLQEVISLLEKTTGIPIVLDRAGLNELGVSYDSQVNCNIKRATLRSVLKKVLGDLNLAYIIKDEAIQVVSIDKARTTLTTRSYYVGDLVGLNGGAGFFGPFTPRLQAVTQLQEIMVLITQSIDPESWAVNNSGGLGSIAFNPISFTFVVRQTAEMHLRMGLGGK